MADGDADALAFDALLAIRPAGPGCWQAPAAPITGEKRIFGGLLIAASIVAASTETRRCHSLHAHFINPGATGEALDIMVEAVRDGGSFATRRVDIRQNGRLLLAGQTSHHDGDEGADGQSTMPDLPPPEGLTDQRETRRRRAEQASGTPRRYLSEILLDVRPVTLPAAAWSLASRAVWVRPRLPVGDAPALHRAAIGFASDAGLVHVGRLAHAQRGGGEAQTASLDHAIWFHRETDANDWMLHVQHAVNVAHGRGLSHAQVFTRGGVLAASVSQEILVRARRETPHQSADRSTAP